MTPSPAMATPPGPNGRITFQRWGDDGFAQIWTANPDLTAQHQITSGDRNSGWAVWSPDATRIAFDSDRADPNLDDNVVVNDVYTMRADGSDVRRLTDSVGFSGDPAFSPDGSLLAFDSDGGSEGHPGPNAIFLMRVDGTEVRRVSTPPVGSYDSEPRFSPDGKRIVFTRAKDGHTLHSGRVVGDIAAIHTVRADGTDLRRVTGWGNKSEQVDWSPDGTTLMFEQACCRLGTGGIFTVPATGGAFTIVANGHGVTGTGNPTALQIDGYYDPVYSPDGTKILAGHEFLDKNGQFRVGLVVAGTDGNNLHWVSDDAHGEHQPDWGTAPLE